jgi:aspartyl-tRNA(Asn)/glutamyl-tRNA(Gln) amidotransferase subunit C
MISKEEIEHIAKLARLELTDDEVKKMQKDLTAILGYFELLKKSPKSKAQSPTKTQNPNLRKDEIKRSDLSGDLISAAPDKKDGYIKVKVIL